MLKEIGNGLNECVYRIKRCIGTYIYVATDSDEELFRYIAKKQLKGYNISSVCLLSCDGSTSKVSVLSNSEYKRILEEEREKMLKNEKK